MSEINHPALDNAAANQPVKVEAPTRSLAIWLDYILTGCLFLLAFAEPLSIAATQFAWSLGLIVWLARLAARPRPRLRRTPGAYALLGFFILTLISAFFSYV